jgi:hypothetical protein
MLRFIVVLVLVLLTACGTPTPPISFAPGGDVVKSAIALSLELTQQRLTQQLHANHPVSDISNIKVENLEPIYLGKLPTYHLQGTYNLKLELPEQQVTQKGNPFDVYIQRQREGKTWRLVKRETNEEGDVQWLTYLIHQGNF